MSFGLCHFLCSDFEHKMEGELLKLLRQSKEAGGSASLTFFITGDGKMKAKLEVELDPPAPASPGSSSPSPTTTPAPGGGRRRRRKGAAAKAKAKARAALHRATQAAATPPAVSPQPPRRPLKHLPPAPDGRQAVHTVGRPAMPSFASLNLDGSPPSPPPRPPPKD